MRMPAYYRPDFSQAELATIERLAGPVAAAFGYGDSQGSL